MTGDGLQIRPGPYLKAEGWRTASFQYSPEGQHIYHMLGPFHASKLRVAGDINMSTAIIYRSTGSVVVVPEEPSIAAFLKQAGRVSFASHYL